MSARARALAYVDGQICALADARIPLTEAGFTRSDATHDGHRDPARITRQTVLDLAAELGIPAKVAPLPGARLRDAEEVFLTSTAGGVMPVGTLDGRSLASCRPGSRTPS